MNAFSAIAQIAIAPKTLDAKNRQLIALGIGRATCCFARF